MEEVRQGELFATSALATKCPICGTHQQPGDTRAPECGVDLSRKAGDWIRRPSECLNMPRPDTDPIPL